MGNVKSIRLLEVFKKLMILKVASKLQEFISMNALCSHYDEIQVTALFV